MEQIEISTDDGGVQTLNDVRYIPEFIKNLIYLSTIQENDFSYKSDGDKYIMMVSKGTLTLMRARGIVGNIYKLLENNVVGDVTSIKPDSDTTKLWNIRLNHLMECGMIEIYNRNLLNCVHSFKMDLCKYCMHGKQ